MSKGCRRQNANELEQHLKKILRKDTNNPTILVDYGEGRIEAKEFKETKHTDFWSVYCEYIYSGGGKIKIHQVGIEALPFTVAFKGKLSSLELPTVVCEIQTFLMIYLL